MAIKEDIYSDFDDRFDDFWGNRLNTLKSEGLSSRKKPWFLPQVYSEIVEEIGLSGLKRNRRNFRRRYVWLSAVVLLVVLGVYGSSVVMQKKKRKKKVLALKVAATAATDKPVSLSDSSEVTVFAHSTLVYPAFFEDSRERLVFLSGFADFKIRENKNRTFRIVHKKNIFSTQDAHFTIEAHGKDSAKVQIRRGKLGVSEKGGGNTKTLVAGTFFLTD